MNKYSTLELKIVADLQDHMGYRRALCGARFPQAYPNPREGGFCGYGQRTGIYVPFLVLTSGITQMGKADLVWFVERVAFGCSNVKLLLRVGSAPSSGSSNRGARSTGAPCVSTSMTNMHMNSSKRSTYTLPSANHARTQEIRTLLRGESILDDGVVGQEFVKLGDELLELAEYEEGAIFGPRWASNSVACLVQQN